METSCHSSLVRDWFGGLPTRLGLCSGGETEENCRDGLGRMFYTWFGDTDDNYTCDNYTLEGGDIPEGWDQGGGLPNGWSKVIRRRCWVWPRSPGFTSFTKLQATEKLHSLEADFEVGSLRCGRVKFSYCNGVTVTLHYRGGAPEGLAIAEFEGQVIWAGNLWEGEVRGPVCARDPDSGGLLLGQTIGGHLTGGDICYVYPDLETALVGIFEEGVMKEAREARVISFNISSDILTVTTNPDSKKTLPTFSFAPSNKEGFGCSDPRLRDPLENKKVQVLCSQMSGGGEGLFARETLGPGTLASVFNGWKVPLQESDLGTIMNGHLGEEEVYERLAYIIHMPQEEDFFIDIPPHQADLALYCGSLGHKVNHSFHPNCEFGTMHHPRWGRVRTVNTLTKVNKGEELLVNYGYDLVRCPLWFRDLWEKEVGPETGRHL